MLESEYITAPCVCYPSVHCGLPASRVRSRAHLLKSEKKKKEKRDLMSGCFSHSVLTLGCVTKRAAAYMRVSCILWCGGRLCTRASGTWGWSRADLKGKRSGLWEHVRLHGGHHSFTFLAFFFDLLHRLHPPSFIPPDVLSLSWNCPDTCDTEVCAEASPVICFRNFSFFRRSLGNTTVEREEMGKDCQVEPIICTFIKACWH